MLGRHCSSMNGDRNVCSTLELCDDLLALIVTRLPLQETFRLRCVCKAWKTFFTDDRILQYFFQFLSQTPMYTASLGNELAAYSVETRSWNRWTSTLHSKYVSRYKVRGNVGDWLLVEGLVKIDDPLRNLFLVNTTKSSSKKLPSLPPVQHWHPFVLLMDSSAVGFATGLIPGESSESCRAFIVNGESIEEDPDYEALQRSYKVYLYDSKLDSWKAIWQWEQERGETLDSITVYEGALHCIFIEEDEDDECYRNTNVCRFNEQGSYWQELSAQLSGKFRFQHLFEWQGHLMIVGGRDGAQQNESGLASICIWEKSRLATVQIWELDQKNHVWRESTRMPDRVLDHFYPPDFCSDLGSEMEMYDGRFSSEVCGHFICLTHSLHVSEGPLMTTKHDYHKHVMYDLSKNSWWEVPKPPFSYSRLGFGRLTPRFGCEEA